MTVDHRWYSILDDLDAHLRYQAAAFEAGQPELIVAFPLPPGLGALPPNLEPRFACLRARSDELIRAVTARRDDIGRRLALFPRRRVAEQPAARPVACYFDTSA